MRKANMLAHYHMTNTILCTRNILPGTIKSYADMLAYHDLAELDVDEIYTIRRHMKCKVLSLAAASLMLVRHVTGFLMSF